MRKKKVLESHKVRCINNRSCAG